MHEKRETGLKEISRLSLILEEIKTGKTNESVFSIEKRFSRIIEPLKPVQISQINNVQNENSKKVRENVKNLKKVKEGLDDVYKGIIMAITNERINQNKDSRKATGKLKQLVKGPLPAEIFMTIEKKMNDTIVLFQEYMENFEWENIESFNKAFLYQSLWTICKASVNNVKC